MMQDDKTEINVETKEKYYTCFYNHDLSDLMAKSVIISDYSKNKHVTYADKGNTMKPQRRMCWNVNNCGNANTNPRPDENWCSACAQKARRSAMLFPPGTCDYCRVKLLDKNEKYPPYCTSVKPTCFFRQNHCLDRNNVGLRFKL